MPDYHLLAETEDYLVIDKAPGISVHRDQAETGLVTRVARDQGVEQLFLVHRLDKMTSGLMLLAKSSAVAAQLAELFRERRIEKYYIALSDNKPSKKQGLIKGDMMKARRGSWKLNKTAENPALTRFFSCAPVPGIRLFLVKPLTGKTHQIRVALKSIGAAIIGDERYHATTEELADRGYLHAWCLAFDWRGERKEYCCEPVSGELFQRPEIQQQLQNWYPPGNVAWPNS
ncbi:TIGR01621 family pseudouridine synthase [Amphritea balenae]|uniref:TIGR01621 family pseudouridine synthase n=1 Tax=Amphritea balenae TaxID=452629 RepID=A0A3P1STQ8_9GAMM|nr:TIGR01621 family pseudouridine synthase [Amphritea balenae]RRD00589.1 TIGR01621 family pseudouridine synthase [Amphritea balenae]GGK69531.1 RNA pseudouridine synthase [Amphritea balenae]